ncbi:MAG: Ig-like domain-containing protein [Clostridiales bacterium]|nr:Ig-like domain-containing protein [Clostridiales bacterium]
MKQLWKRLLAGSMAICMAGMCVVTSFAASEEDIVLETVFGTSDDYEIAAQAVESLLDEEEEEESAAEEEDESQAEEEATAAAAEEETDQEEDTQADADQEEPEESEESTAYAAIAWLTGDGTYQESASYTYTGEAICPDYQVTVDGEMLDTAALTEQWFADEAYTEQTTELTFTDCGTYFLQLTDAEGAVVARGSYAITPAEQEITGVDTTSYSLSCKSTFQLSPAAQGELSYQSSDTSVVTVTSAGKCTVVGAGTATITITAAATQNYNEATAEVTVTGTRLSQTITLTKTSYTKKYSSGGTFSLGASTSGDGKLTYASSDTSVVKVSSSGKCTMKGVGTATITVTAAKTSVYKKATATVEVTVYTKAKTLSYSSSYKKGKYYKALMALKLTGGKRSNIVAIALSQLGYHESNSKSKLAGTSSGSGNYTEYGRYYGLSNGAWCAMFVSWCAREAGVSTSVIPKYAAVRNYHSYYKKKGRFYSWTKVRKKSYVPKQGDLIIYANVKGGTAHHIGYVISVTYTSSKVKIVTVEGNSNDQVRKKTLTLKRSSSNGKINGQYILGFAKPNY